MERSGWERETVINMCDAEPDVVHVWTSQRKIGHWVERMAGCLGVEVTKTSRPTWSARFPAHVMLLRQRPRRKMTDAQRQVLSARLKRYRPTREEKPK